jgi:hypothetical protein
MKKRTLCESEAYSTCLDAVFKMTILNDVLDVASCSIYSDYLNKIASNKYYYDTYKHTLKSELKRYFKENKIKRYDNFLGDSCYYDNIKKSVSFYLRLASAMLDACLHDKDICLLIFDCETITIKDRNIR